MKIFTSCFFMMVTMTASTSAAELVETFETSIDPAKWDINNVVAEGGKGLISDGMTPLQSAVASLLSVSSYTLEYDFVISTDFEMTPLSQTRQGRGTIGLVFTAPDPADNKGVFIMLDRQFSTLNWDSYEVSAGSVATGVSRAGDMDPNATDSPQSDWPLDSNQLSLTWDASTGFLTPEYDGIGGRQTLSPLNLLAPATGFSLTSSFKISFGIAQSADAYNNARTTQTMDNISFHQVPEPSTAFLIMAPALLLTRRRSRSQD